MKLCECGCGRPTPVQKHTHNDQGLKRGEQSRFIKGHHRRIVHGLKSAVRRTPEWLAYNNALRRCSDPSRPEWKNYGGRGIKVLFASFEQFFKEIGRRTSRKHSLDRFPNNDGNYEQGNVRWATRIQQARNKRPLLHACSDAQLMAEVQRRKL